MSASRACRAMVVLAAAALVGACAAGSSASPAAGPSPESDTVAVAELEELYWTRLESAATRYVDADVHFMSAMIGHHAQALVMAELAPGRTVDRAVRTLAARILRAQKDEIALMEQWLRDRGQPLPEAHQHHARMPGMLSPEQMASLEEASGPEFDRLFLTFMIKHHRGAVTMVHELFATDGAGQDPAVFKFASDVQVDQATEIARMERMLVQLDPGGSLP